MLHIGYVCKISMYCDLMEHGVIDPLTVDKHVLLDISSVVMVVADV